MVVLPPPGLALRLFTKTISCCFLQTRWFWLGPRSCPRILLMRTLLWAGRSLPTSATSFLVTTHEHITASAVLARRRGLPYERCHARCAFHAERSCLFVLQSRFDLMRRSELRVISPTPGLETRTPKARELSPPRTTPFRWARRTWEPRRSKERSKDEPTLSRDDVGPDRRLLSAVLPLCSFEPLLSLTMRARWVGAHSRASTRPHRSPRSSFRLVCREARPPFRKPRGFSPWESNAGRDRSL
jgi:hypothetical protein